MLGPGGPITHLLAGSEPQELKHWRRGDRGERQATAAIIVLKQKKKTKDRPSDGQTDR